MRSRILDQSKLELNVNERNVKKIVKRRNTYRKLKFVLSHFIKKDKKTCMAYRKLMINRVRYNKKKTC
jgi:hypothetical protein